MKKIYRRTKEELDIIKSFLEDYDCKEYTNFYVISKAILKDHEGQS